MRRKSPELEKTGKTKAASRLEDQGKRGIGTLLIRVKENTLLRS